MSILDYYEIGVRMHHYHDYSDIEMDQMYPFERELKIALLQKVENEKKKKAEQPEEAYAKGYTPQ